MICVAGDVCLSIAMISGHEVNAVFVDSTGICLITLVTYQGVARLASQLGVNCKQRKTATQLW